MKTKFFFAAIAAICLVASCKQDEPIKPAPTPLFNVEGVTGNAINVPAAGTAAGVAATTFTVASNISWAATVADGCDWISIDPDYAAIEDFTETETVVTVTVPENTSLDPRSSSLTVTAEGFDPIVISVSQAAAEAKTLSVYDAELKDITELNVDPLGADITVMVNTNTSWTATVADGCDWVSIDPASGTEAGAAVISVALNTTSSARESSITFTGVNVPNPVVVAIKQAKGNTLAISVANITYQTADVTITPSSNDFSYYTILTAKSTYNQLIGMGYDDAGCALYFAKSNAKANNMDLATFLGYVVKTGVNTINYIDLPDNTDLVCISVGLDGEGTPVSAAAKLEFKTAAKPVEDPAYTALLGTYTFSAYDYFEEAPISGNLIVKEGLVNEYFKLAIEGCGWCPDYYKSDDVIDFFDCPWDKASNTISMINGTLGDYGMYWNFGSLGTCGIQLDIFFMTAEDAIDKIVLTPNASGDLVATSPAVPSGDYLCLRSGIYDATGDTGYSNGIFIFLNGMTFKAPATSAAPASAKSGLQCYEASNVKLPAQKKFSFSRTPFYGR